MLKNQMIWRVGLYVFELNNEMGEQIYFNSEELDELMWIIPQFKSLHEDTWMKEEAKIVDNIIKKFIGSPSETNGE